MVYNLFKSKTIFNQLMFSFEWLAILPALFSPMASCTLKMQHELPVTCPSDRLGSVEWYIDSCGLYVFKGY